MNILQSIKSIITQITSTPKVEIQYKSVVKKDGNPAAVKAIYDVFKDIDSSWRGLGKIPLSGLGFKKVYKTIDATTRFGVELPKSREPKGCACGQVLKGLVSPQGCKLFAKTCRPDNPIGPCMVSSEGSCAAYYRYERLRDK